MPGYPGAGNGSTSGVALRDLVVGNSYRLQDQTTVIPTENYVETVLENVNNATLQLLHDRPHRIFRKRNLPNNHYEISFYNVPGDGLVYRNLFSIKSIVLPQGADTMFLEEPITGGRRKRKTRRNKKNMKRKSRKY